ncbi:MAG: hypothetical protein GVY24_05715 [Planctomycetes bacterium]|jgi:hypothetical protein|nr:hypothetical protein [Planctomycetota bacterium]
MFIIWGTRIRRKPSGRVAAFCEPCDDIRAHRVTEVREVSHLYFIPLGRGSLVGHEGRCEGCRASVALDGEAFAAFVTEPDAPLDDLIARTNPDLPEELERWRDLQARVVEGDISEEERLGLLVNKVTDFADAVQARAAQMHIDGWSALAFLGGVALSIVACGWVAASIKDDQAQVIGFLVAALASFAPTLYFLITDVRRFTRRKVIPPLADTLAPLCPSREDLAAALAQVRQTGLKIGKHVKLDPLADAVASRMARDLRGETA